MARLGGTGRYAWPMPDEAMPPMWFDAKPDPSLDITDPATGKSRVCAEQCHACWFDPRHQAAWGIDPDALAEELEATVEVNSYVICQVSGHDTPTGFAPAICAGFLEAADANGVPYWQRSWRTREIIGRDLTLRVTPPAPPVR